MKRSILALALALAAGASSAVAQVKIKSKPEADAYNAMLQAAQSSPDALIAAAENLLTNFADTQFKDLALSMEANAYQEKGDWAKALIFADRALAVNPSNFQAGLTAGEVLVVHTGENDFDRDEKLAKADKYLNNALDALKAATKSNPQASDAEWEEYKKVMLARLRNDLGLGALVAKKYDVAIADFKAAIEDDLQPTYEVRLASAEQKAGHNDEAIALCDKVLADPQLHPAIRRAAMGIKSQAVSAKAMPAATAPKP